MHLEEAVAKFERAMVDKFYERDARQGDRSVTRVGAKHLNEPDARAILWNHLEDEIEEFRAAPDDPKEAIDVANMAFLLWWSLIEKATEGA